MRFFAVAVLMLLCAAAGLFGETRIVSFTSEGKTSTYATEVVESSEGQGLRVVESGEEGSASTLLAEDGTVRLTESRAREGTIRMESDGKVVLVSGSWKDKSVSGRYELKGDSFYGQGFEFAARAFMRGACKPLRFPMIQLKKPSKATIMVLTKEGAATFKGREATKAKVSLSGALGAFWSAHLLLDEEGKILRYEGNQGPGTADMVTELVEVRQ